MPKEELIVSSEFVKIDPRKILEEEDAVILKSYASHKDTPMDVLLILSNHDDWRIRSRVAQNTSTPPYVLDRLANDSDYETMYYVAANPSTDPQTLTRFLATAVVKGNSDDEEEIIKLCRITLANPNTPLETLLSFITVHNYDSTFTVAVKSNPTYINHTKSLCNENEKTATVDKKKSISEDNVDNRFR